MFIKREILTEFGILDEVYGSGDNAENDWVMRANRCGYRTALANHAFVYHSGEASSFISETPKTIQEDTNRAILTSHYPEYPERVRAYFDSAHYRAEKLLVGLLKDTRGRHDVVFDFSNFGPHHNGTFEAAKQILKHAAETWHRDFNIHVIAYEAAARFHALDKIGGVLLLAPTTHRVFAIAFRFGQPFQCDALLRMSRLAVINVYAMLDPIAWDCLYLNTPDLDEIWKAVFSYADAITYISDFVGNQFHLRFRPHSRLKELSCYLSLDLSEYTSSRPGTCEGQNDHLSDESQPGGYLLVIGNHLAHKHVAPTVQALSQKLPRQKIVALGMEGTRLHNVTGYASGHLSEDKLESLFANAAVVIFPSFYEGFGIPILRSLAFRKPLFARSIPVNRDLFKRLGQPESFVLYDSTDDLIMRLCNGLPNWKNSVEPTGSKHTWASLVLQLRSLFKDLLQSVSFQDVLLPRLEHLLILEKVSDLTRSNAERDLQLRDLQRQISDLQVTVHDREARIEDLLSSMSWTVTAPLRSAAKAWLRAIDAVRSSNGRERK